MITNVHRVITAHRNLPRLLRLWFLVPLIIMLVTIGGMFFTLPPGPLCDEGMVLFMEGSCDWGGSNVFFFSKLGLLLGLNFAFYISWRYRLRSFLGFLPHFVVLAVLSLWLLSDPECEHYYTHANGSFGQMIIEAMAFAVLGIALLHRFADSSHRVLVVPLLIAWNAFYIGIFYVFLGITNHWTWLHTGLIAVILLVTSLVVA